MGDNETAYRMAEALGVFYKDVLSGGKTVVSIEKELEIIRSYLYVQSIRYRDRFTYEIDVDPEILPYPVVKMTLQPLVENAIYHGIREIEETGHIRVEGYRQEDCIIIRVVDNGKGFPKDQETPEGWRKRISEELPKEDAPGENRGFGMYSVDERIRLYFGEQYGLAVIPAEKGACVEVRLPAAETEVEI